MTIHRKTDTLVSRLRYRGEPFTLADIAELGRITPASARHAASRLLTEGTLEALPIRGTYALPGWQERPWGDLTIFAAWLRVHPGRGWVDSREAPWLRGAVPKNSRPRDVCSGEPIKWRIEVASRHAERTLEQFYSVRRVTHRPTRGVETIPGVKVPLGL